jgi:hypothetical protein
MISNRMLNRVSRRPANLLCPGFLSGVFSLAVEVEDTDHRLPTSRENSSMISAVI